MNAIGSGKWAFVAMCRGIRTRDSCCKEQDINYEIMYKKNTCNITEVESDEL